MEETLLQDRSKELKLPESHVQAAVTQSYALYYGFTIIAIGCGIIAYLLVHESRAWRHLVWDVLHATGITDAQHKTLRDLIFDVIKIVREGLAQPD